jgi:hypothetical protein
MHDTVHLACTFMPAAARRYVSRYRQLAREAWAAANTLPVGKARDAVLHMAQVWERLAHQHAHSTVSLSPSEREQPVIQQTTSPA